MYLHRGKKAKSIDFMICNTGSCSGSEYRCTGGQCISGSNKCDSYRQCGESLDECEVTRTMSWIAGVVVGVVLIIVIIGVGIFCLKRFLRNRHSSGGVVKVCIMIVDVRIMMLVIRILLHCF